MKDILIIDDDSKNIFALSEVLKSKKYNCLTATSAEEGFQLLSTHKNIGVILMDMMMPEMDGYEAISLLKEKEDYKDIPIIAVTAQAMIGDRERCIDAGAFGYVSKPIKIEELLSLLRKII